MLVRQHAPLVIADVEVPEPGVGQVLVKIVCSGICGKQLDEVDGKQGADPYLPHLLGHEGAGIVRAIGPGVRKVKPGDRVVLHWMKGSGIDAATPQFRWNGTTVNAGCVTTFSEDTIASENRLTPIPEDVPFEVAALLGCAVTTGLGIVFNLAVLKPGQSIAVFGVGGVGVNVIQGARLVNAHPIVAVDLHEHKLSQAMSFGASHTLNAADPDLPSRLRTVSDGQGCDVTVDTTGLSQVRQMAYEATSRSGVTILAGVPHHKERMTIDSFPLHFGRRIIGVHGGDTRPDADIPRYLRLHRLGRLTLEDQITHRFGLDEVNAALALVREGRAGRCLLQMPTGERA